MRRSSAPAEQFWRATSARASRDPHGTLLCAPPTWSSCAREQCKRWNAAFDAGQAAALGKPLITLHPPEHDHALRRSIAPRWRSPASPSRSSRSCATSWRARCRGRRLAHGRPRDGPAPEPVRASCAMSRPRSASAHARRAHRRRPRPRGLRVGAAAPSCPPMPFPRPTWRQAARRAWPAGRPRADGGLHPGHPSAMHTAPGEPGWSTGSREAIAWHEPDLPGYVPPGLRRGSTPGTRRTSATTGTRATRSTASTSSSTAPRASSTRRRDGRDARARALFETQLPTRFYLPPGDVDLAAFAPRARKRLVVRYKGQASYSSLPDTPDVAWFYPEPLRGGGRGQGHDRLLGRAWPWTSTASAAGARSALSTSSASLDLEALAHCSRPRGWLEKPITNRCRRAEADDARAVRR